MTDTYYVTVQHKTATTHTVKIEADDVDEAMQRVLLEDPYDGEVNVHRRPEVPVR